MESPSKARADKVRELEADVDEAAFEDKVRQVVQAPDGEAKDKPE